MERRVRVDGSGAWWVVVRNRWEMREMIPWSFNDQRVIQPLDTGLFLPGDWDTLPRRSLVAFRQCVLGLIIVNYSFLYFTYWCMCCGIAM